jgi:hypothetical protein
MCPSVFFLNLIFFFYLLILGGVLFKIYIVGEAIKVVRRFSLPNVTKQELSKVEGVFRFPRVSSAAASADDADLDPSVAGEILGKFCFSVSGSKHYDFLSYF